MTAPTENERGRKCRPRVCLNLRGFTDASLIPGARGLWEPDAHGPGCPEAVEGAKKEGRPTGRPCDPETCAPPNGERGARYMLIGWPYASRVASITASERVGCGCIDSMISKPVVSSLREATTSAMSSVALCPIM